MKQIMKNTRQLAMTLAALFTLGLATPVFANNFSADPVELKFLGNYRNQPVFQLDLNNAIAGEFSITVKDKNDHVLYTEVVKGENISRKYRLNSDELDISGITFVVTNRKENASTSYEVTSKTRTINEVSINKQ